VLVGDLSDREDEQRLARDLIRMLIGTGVLEGQERIAMRQELATSVVRESVFMPHSLHL
jgi:hypothetical protein